MPFLVGEVLGDEMNHNLGNNFKACVGCWFRGFIDRRESGLIIAARGLMKASAVDDLGKMGVGLA